MKYIIILIAFFFALPAFAIFQEGSGDACTLPDGSFREECMYMTGVPTPTKMSPRAALQVGSWWVSTLNGKPISPSGSLTFSRNTFSAKLCNTLSGQYGTLRGDILIARRVISTKMYCDSDIMTVEDAMRHFTLSRFIIGDTTLTITTRKGDVIIWTKK